MLKRKTHILVECPELISSVRVGVLEPLSPLVESNKCEVRFKRTLDITKEDILWCDVVIIVRGSELITLRIVEACKKVGRLIIYFLDDDLLDIPKNISCSSYFENEDIKNNIKKILSYSDVNWCVNKLISEKYKIYSNARWFIGKVPTNIVSTEYKEYKDDFVNIIYAGSKDHTKNVRKFISPIVKKVENEFKKVRFIFIGVDPGICNSDRVIVREYFDNYDEYKAYVSSMNFQIGLAPLGDEAFYKYKYYNKFIEYTNINCVGVYTDSEPYRSIVEDGTNGLLCKNSVDDWYNAIRFLLLNEAKRYDILNNARNLINEKFNYFIISSELEIGIPELIEYRALDVSIKDINLLNNTKLYFYISRLKLLWKNYKLLIILVLPYKIAKKLLKKFGGNKY